MTPRRLVTRSRQTGPVVAALLLGGCSFLFTSAPPSNPGPVLECTTSNRAPILDTVWAGFSAFALVAAVPEQEDPENRAVGYVLYGVTGAAAAVGAVLGYRQVARCRGARDDALRRAALLSGSDSVVAPPPSQPTPAVELEEQNLIPVDHATGRLLGSSHEVLAIVTPGHLEQVGEQLGRIYAHTKEPDGTCDPTNARLLHDRPVVQRAEPESARIRGLIKPETKADLAFFARLKLDLEDKIALLDLQQMTVSLSSDMTYDSYLTRLATQSETAGKCLYFIRRAKASRLTVQAFSEALAKQGTGAWAINVYGTYYASPDERQVVETLLLELHWFDFVANRLVTRPLEEGEARAFEVALAR